MTELTERLDAIQARLDPELPLCSQTHGHPDPQYVCLAPKGHGEGRRGDVAFLLDLARKQAAALERVEQLAALWHSRGEHDMVYSKTIPDEDIAMAILTDGAQRVDNARHIRNALGEADEPSHEGWNRGHFDSTGCDGSLHASGDCLA